ncbi:hypothetical protein PTKIN_Ptkin17bG0040700 [Pterospermum kingtungense]
MDISNVCPTEDAIQEFLDYLVEPLLPAKYIRETPKLEKQKAVAKQVHAVVLLYNYYHRKEHPYLKYLGFEPFCELALLLKPNLKSYLNFMLRSDDTESSDLGKQLSLTEKAIKDACDISISLDASRNSPSLKGWPVSRVAVLLIDPRKEKCFLQNGSITKGVWSMIEKDVNESYSSSGGSIEAKHMNKRKRIHDKHLQNELGADKGLFQQLAFSAVKEATNGGISQSDLTILESHVVYSLSKEKTATWFCIMQSIHAKEDGAYWIPIKDVIDSLQGPLVKRSSLNWTFTSVVEYFHLLPYAWVISRWSSRYVFPNSFQDQDSVLELVNINGFEMMEEPSESEVQDCRNRNQINGGVVETFSNTTGAESEKQNEKCFKDVFPNSFQDQDLVMELVNVNGFDMMEERSEPEVHECRNRNQINGDVVETFRNTTSAELGKQNEKLCFRDVFPNIFQDQDQDSVLELVNVNGFCMMEEPSEPEVHDCRNRNQINGGVVETFRNTTSAKSEKQNEKSCFRDVFPNSFQDQDSVLELVNVNGFEMTEESSEPKVHDRRNRNQINGVVETFRNTSSAELEKQNEKNELCTNGFLDAIDGPWNMDLGYRSVVYSKENLISRNVVEKVQHDSQLKKMSSCAGRDLNGMTNVAKFEVVDSTFQNVNHLKGQKVADKKAAWKNEISCQGGIPAGNHALVIHEANSKYSAKLQNAIASKEHILTETALRVLLCKRDKLVLQQRNIGDEISQYDKKLQTILNGGEDDLELKIDLIIEGCNDVCLKSSAESGKPNPCQASLVKNPLLFFPFELDGICIERNWILPTYQVFPSDGGYQAKVSVQGMDFKSSIVGDACPKPSEARASAAVEMLAKLRTMLAAATH